ncbi:MAG: DUF3784 domain-containing protein [Clostridia bacterium]|nr:DUF3784 domain-containing protein [Clostridia bacterium]
MMFGLVILGLTALAFLGVGYLILKKERVDLLHSHHRDKVAEADRAAFCSMAGLGVCLIGIGCAATAVILGFTQSALSFVAFAAGLAVGLCLLIGAEKRYNSGK